MIEPLKLPELDFVEVAMISVGNEDEAKDRYARRTGFDPDTPGIEKAILEKRAEIKAKQFIYKDEFLKFLRESHFLIRKVQLDLPDDEAHVDFVVKLEVAGALLVQASKIMDIPEYNFTGVKFEKV